MFKGLLKKGEEEKDKKILKANREYYCMYSNINNNSTYN